MFVPQACSLTVLVLVPLQGPPGDPSFGGQVLAVRPRPARASQGHHELHAADEIHVRHDTAGERRERLGEKVSYNGINCNVQ